MGAIAGIFSPSSQEFLSEDLLRNMCASLSHRGPDGNGIFMGEAAALGHLRFDTIGARKPLAQPVVNDNQGLVLTFNGAIYNYEGLKKGLELKGYKFSSLSDSEIILPLYKEYGVDCVKKMDGMFAFVIYDVDKKQLFVARDRTGEKPLYYTWHNNTFFFASEIKAFWNIPGFSPGLSTEGAFNYFQFTQSPAPFTLYDGIKKLMSAHYMVVDHRGISAAKPYWSLDFAAKTELPFDQARDKLEDVLKASIRRAMTSDVPVSALLSGGVDSSTIVGMMNELSEKKIKTFTIGAAANEYNKKDPEFDRAARIATRYQTDHHVLEYETTSFEDFRRALRFYDEPVGIFDSIQQLYLNRYVKDHAKVILSGTAADTILAEAAVFPEVRGRNASLQRQLTGTNKKFQIDRILADTQNIIHYEQAKTFMPEDMVAFAKRYDAMEYLAPYFAFGNYDDMWGAELFIEFFVYFSHISSFNDNIGMTCGVEVRAPFVDHHLLKYAATLPEEYIIKMISGQREQKYILKEVAKKYMPEDMVYAPKIMCGQFIDWQEMMKTMWKDDVDNLFKIVKTDLAHLISYEKVLEYWELFETGNANFRQRYNFLRIVMFLIWYQETFCKKNPKPGVF